MVERFRDVSGSFLLLRIGRGALGEADFEFFEEFFIRSIPFD